MAGASGDDRSRLPAILAVFAGIEVLLIGLGWGPFRDEAFYAAAGLELLRGETRHLDLYLGWFNGSPFLWPVVSGLGLEFLGFPGSRLLALVSVLTSVALVHGAARRWVGVVAADLGAALILLRGSSLLLGHYPTYDIGAILGLSAALRLMSAERVGAGRALLAGVLLGVGALAKYPYALMGLPIAVLAFHFRSASLRSCLLFAGAGAAVWLSGTWAHFGSILPATISNYDHRAWPRLLVGAVVLVQVAVPLALIAVALRRGGSARTPGRTPTRAGETTRGLQPSDRRALLLGVALLLLWPALHLGNARITSAFKHIWVATVLLLPIVGMSAHVALERLGRRARRGAIAALVLFAAAEWFVLEPLTYTDHRAILRDLDGRLAPGDRVAVTGDNDRWIYTTWLYSRGWTDSPVPDEIATPDELCAYDWVVHSLRAPLEGRPATCRLVRVTPNSDRRGYRLQPGRVTELWRVAPTD